MTFLTYTHFQNYSYVSSNFRKILVGNVALSENTIGHEVLGDAFQKCAIIKSQDHIMLPLPVSIYGAKH